MWGGQWDGSEARKESVKYSSQSMVLGPAAPISPGKLLEMQMLRSYPTSSDSDTPGVHPETDVLTSHPGDGDVHTSLRSTFW